MCAFCESGPAWGGRAAPRPGPARGVTPRRGGSIERTEDWRAWKAILRQAGVRDARVHDARHTAATLLIEQGVHIRVVQEVLGHTRVTTTERYTHVATLQMRDASERMSEALWARDELNCNPNCNLWLPRRQAPSPHVPGEGLRAAEDRGFEPRRVVTPNRISSAAP
jgi:hypothetical protein